MKGRRWRPGDATLLLLLLAAAGFVVFALVKSSGGGDAQAVAGGPTGPAVATARRAGQELAALATTHEAFAAPGSRPFERIGARRPITDEQTVVPVVRLASHRGVDWLQVRLPGRPNGHTGWIEQTGTRLEYTPWRIVVDTSARHVYAYDGGRIVRSFAAVIGAPATPTPKGQFFVEETVAEPPSAVGHPYALALSARTDVYQEFDGGPGQIALHGLDNVGGTPGSAVSHGCVRLATGEITWLAWHIAPGVPVIIR
jgi:lipoprotein-anchoring transpeptidase ErfK/SrfK